MIAEPPIRLRARWTTARVTAVILIGLGGLMLLPLAGRNGFLVGYLGLVLVTCIVLRGARRSPGSWLGRRAVRRAVVGLIGVDCLALVASTAPASSAVLALFLLLVVLNVALGGATQRVATAPDSSVDERQESLRNRAHRIAYLIFALLIGVAAVADVASTQTRSWLGSSLGGGGFFAFLEVLFVLPAMVFAFLDSGYEASDIRELRAERIDNARARWAMVLVAVTVAMPVLLSLTIEVLPVRTTSTFQGPVEPFGNSVASCREFFANRQVGVGVEAQLPLHVEACWDGKRAYESYGMNQSDCFLTSSISAIVTTTQCTRTTSAAGTLTFTYRADVAPGLIPFLHRQVGVRLVIDRNGTVEQFP